MNDNCSNCNTQSNSVHPAKFSLGDKYLKYRTRDKYA